MIRFRTHGGTQGPDGDQLSGSGLPTWMVAGGGQERIRLSLDPTCDSLIPMDTLTIFSLSSGTRGFISRNVMCGYRGSSLSRRRSEP